MTVSIQTQNDTDANFDSDVQKRKGLLVQPIPHNSTRKIQSPGMRKQKKIGSENALNKRNREWACTQRLRARRHIILKPEMEAIIQWNLVH